jgi:sialic acid synthase SpsE
MSILEKYIKAGFKKTYIIAEIGGNFNTFGQAKKLILSAKKCGVDAVKIQTYKADTLASKKAKFNMENTGKVSQYELFKKYQLSNKLHEKIFTFAKKIDIDFFSTPAHEKDVDMLESFNVPIHKIGSDDAVNIPFLEYVAKTKKIIILSTGMCTLSEVKRSVQAIYKHNRKLIVLHCVSNYPTKTTDVNLKAIETLKSRFPKISIGFSDHTVGISASLYSVSFGARIIEKHFTLNKKAKGPDHMLSADPSELYQLVKIVREYNFLKGDGKKTPNKTEIKNKKNNRKSLVIEKNIEKGMILNKEYISIKRPGYGIEPKDFYKVIGKKTLKKLKKDHVIKWSDIK